MNFVIADTFQKALGRLTSEEQALAKQSAFDFQMNPKSPGFSYEDLKAAKDKNLWSFRVSRSLRIIVHRTQATFALCYVGHHDEAYAWAERRRIEVHPVTGAAQIVEVIERTEEHVRRIVREEVVEPPVFRRFEKSYIYALGVPEEWLESVMSVRESELEDLLPRLPQEAAERLLDLACGNPVPVPQSVEPSATGFAHPDAQRRFKVVESEDELKRALDAPWDQWMVFLHPTQRKVVGRSFKGPGRVSGAAGTGKTVVALHRAAELAKRHPKARILLTTFSRTLAVRLGIQATTLLGEGSPESERIRIEHLHKIARDVVATQSGKPVSVIEGLSVQQLLADAHGESTGNHFDLGFLKAEWDGVIEAAGIETWEEYRSATRSNRGTPLGAKQRLAVWRVFERALQLMNARNVTTWDRLCLQALRYCSAKPLFDHLIADEYQDFGPSELRLMRALVKPGEDDLLFCGDSGQRIYKPASSWLSLGIDIRGRSASLKVNYRTTEQIRTFADQIVSVALDGGTGEPENRASVSLLQGEKPDVRLFPSVKEEVVAVAEWICEALAAGIQPQEIAVFARTESILKKRAEEAVRRAGLQYRQLKDDDRDVGAFVNLGTMHRAKGLEFKAVAVIGCEDGVLPLDAVAESLNDPADRDDMLDHDRHLLYVACTRARERLLVSAVGQLSRFIPPNALSKGIAK
jgi:superfamily I DNA/RNA helicase